MENFLKYLFCKFFYFQIKIGNKDIVTFMSILMILFSLFLYFSAIGFILLWIFPNVFDLDITFSCIYACIVVFALRIIFITKTSSKKIKIIRKYRTYKASFAYIYFILSLICIISVFTAKWYFNNN